jgi:hypothetical protein
MPTRCSRRPCTWLGLAALCLWAVCATACTAGAKPGKSDPPIPLPEEGAKPGKAELAKPLPDEIVRAWTKAGARVGWMGLNEYGACYFADKAAGLRGAVPAFRFGAWKDGQLAGLPVPAAAFGLDLNRTPR